MKESRKSEEEDDRTLTTRNEIRIVNKISGDDPRDEIVTRVYRKRWIMLFLFIYYAALVAGQWIEYSIIANVVMRYYDVSAFAVDCTSMIYMLYYGIFVFPGTYLTDKMGLRWSIVLGSALCCLGTWIKLLAVSPDRFFVVLIGQSAAALSLVIMLTMPCRVAATWFAAHELSTATSLGIFGSQLGMSVLFLVPPVIVKNRDRIEDIGSDLSVLFWGVAVAATLNFVLIVLFFQDDPKIPPSETRALQLKNAQENKEGFSEPLKRLFKNKSFLILCNSYGLNVGILNAIGTLLNRFFLLHFKDGEEDAGRIGLLLICTGMIASITIGIVLDKTHKFKETTVIIYFLCFLGQILFAVTIFLEIKWMVYASSIFLGFFMSGYLALGYEMATEYTYPESETYSSGILNITNNIYGIILVLILEKVMDYYESDVPVHIIFCGAMFLGLIMTIMTKDEQRRQDARKAAILYQGVPQRDVYKVPEHSEQHTIRET